MILLRFFIFLLLCIWCAGFSVFPVIIKIVPSLAVFIPFLEHSYSIVCHQQQNKCFELNGGHLLVCARCTGIYAGALLASFMLLFTRRDFNIGLKIILLSAVPMIADVILYSIGIYGYSKTIALITGIFSGSIVFIYILPVLEKYIVELKVKNESK